MTTTRSRAAAPSGAADVTLRRLPRSGQRNRVLGGLLLVAVSAALVAWLVTGASHRVSVLVVTRDVPVGQKLTTADLATVQVGADAGVRTVGADQARQVLGLFAAVDLRAGTLLATSELTSAQAPGQGQMVVAVAAKPHQLPDLRPGDQVSIVPTPGAGGTDSAAIGKDLANQPLRQPAPGTVDRIGDPDTDGMIRVDLIVASDAGPVVAQQASTGRFALLVTARRS